MKRRSTVGIGWADTEELLKAASDYMRRSFPQKDGSPGEYERDSFRAFELVSRLAVELRVAEAGAAELWRQRDELLTEIERAHRWYSGEGDGAL